MWHRIVILVAGSALAACGPNTEVGIATATATPSATATATPTPSPTPSPTSEAAAPEITSFSVIEGVSNKGLMVRVHNPNDGVGLIQAGFELTALAADGAIIDIHGLSEGFPGGACCTIYRLPPNGDFGFSIFMHPSAESPASLELAVTGWERAGHHGRPPALWVDWSTVELPLSEVSDATVSVASFGGGPQVTGRVTIAAAQEGPFNVWIVAFVDSPVGQLVVADVVECVSTADPRAFSIETFISGLQGPYTLESIVAYTTTVPGVTQPAPGCP